MKYEVELICDQNLACGESPVWDPINQTLNWVDSGDALFEYNDLKKEIITLEKPLEVAAIAPHLNGGLVMACKTGFYLRDKSGNIKLLSNSCNGMPVNLINEIMADPKGRIYGGQEKFNENNIYEPGFLFMLDVNGETSIVEEGLHISNGMGFSPDLKTFYLVDTIPGNIYAYDFHIDTGHISNKKILIKIDKNEGLPDGMCVDADGFIWIARWFGNGLSRYGPDGKLERKIELPIAQPTSLTFGGKDLNEIYITSAAAYWETHLAPNNHNYKSLRGGSLYRIKQDIIGKSDFMAKVKF